MLPTKFRFIWPCGFREDFLEIDQSETRIACSGHVCKGIRMKWAIFIEDLPLMLSIKFRFIWPCDFRDFLEINQSETRIACSGNVCKRIRMKWAIFIEDLPLMLPIKIRLIWQSDFKGEDSSQIGQSKTRIACSGHVCKWIGTKWAILIENLP